MNAYFSVLAPLTLCGFFVLLVTAALPNYRSGLAKKTLLYSAGLVGFAASLGAVLLTGLDGLRSLYRSDVSAPTSAQEAYGERFCSERGTAAADVYLDRMPRLDNPKTIAPRLVVHCAKRDGMAAAQVVWLKSSSDVPPQ